MSMNKLDSQINKALSGWETPKNKSKKTIWLSIEKSIDAKQNRFVKFSSWRVAVAASIVALLVSYAIFYSSNIEYNTNIGEKMAITLPDGSLVNLNSESKLSYNSISWVFDRDVRMSGEAFFKVIKGSKFSVKTDNGIVKVLGTSFNVISRRNNFMIDCYTGKVEIDNAIEKVIISRGERVIQSKYLALQIELSNGELMSPLWLIDTYSYAKTKLVNVFEDISEQYGINISADSDINKLKLTGEWNNSMKLEDVLQIVCLPFNLEATRLDDKNYIIQQSEL